MNMDKYRDESGRIDCIKIKDDLCYYKGFHDGAKEMIEMLKTINTNEKIEELENKEEMEISIGKIEGKKAEKFIEMIKKLGVE